MRLLRAVRKRLRGEEVLIALVLLGAAIAIVPPHPVNFEMVFAIGAAVVITVLTLAAACVAGPSQPLRALARALTALLITSAVMTVVSLGLELVG
jgi:hypothetical protein